MMVIAVAVTVFGSLAAATVWSPGTYGSGYGSVSLPSQQVSADREVVQLGGTSGQASSQEQTTEAVQLGSNGSPSGSQQQAAATVQLGSVGSQLSSQAPASGSVQLSGCTFGASGGSGGCGSCG
jgi:hypothetical protein